MNKQNSNRTILVVDDKPDNSTIFRIALEDDGFHVDAYNDPELALSSFKPDYCNLVILDIRMPKMNGYDLYEKLGKIDDKVKVCFLIAYGEHHTEEFKTRFTSSAGDDNVSFLRKPMMLDDLVKKVHGIIKQNDNNNATSDV